MIAIEISKIIGWTLFGCTLTIMYFGMFSAMALSNMNSEIRTYHTINMDNETKEAILGLSQINSNECEIRLLNQSLNHQSELFGLEKYYTGK